VPLSEAMSVHWSVSLLVYHHIALNVIFLASYEVIDLFGGGLQYGRALGPLLVRIMHQPSSDDEEQTQL
jgi:hypothetical protein